MLKATSSLTRRHFLQALVGGGLSGPFLKCGTSWGSVNRARPRVAAIVTDYRSNSHADVLLSRLLRGYLLKEQELYAPRTEVVSIYIDQIPETDIGKGLAKAHGAKLVSTIEEGLLLGGNQLAVDGVVIIGEHGDYPYNEKGQHLYPRRRFFEETVNAFRKVGRVAPVFNDKHLGYAWEDAKWMYDQARQMKFPLMAGSTLPTAWRKPDLDYPLDVPLEEGLALGYSDTEAYGFHALETLQCLIERRRGGESGVHAVTYLSGDAVWKAGEAGQWSRSLLDAALRCIPQKPAGKVEEHTPTPEAFLIEHSDGFRSTVLMLNGYISEFAFAGKRAGVETPDAAMFWLQDPVYGHFAYLAHNIETMILEQREVYPPERTLLTTGILDAVMTSRFEKNRRVETPWLEKIAYRSVETPGRRAFVSGS